ncbi:DUF2383 domain-containing protein [Pararhodobacter sp.]|uniref:DUF2383 domain-containing protein n=1 Tax=Pararhodobacter sp. TaxID=2127056 RepID=UPI002FDD508C
MEPIPHPPRSIHPKIEDAPQGVEELTELHTRLVDTIAGFEKMVEKAEPAFRPVAIAFKAMHSAHARAVGEMLVEDGHDPAQDGSLFGAVNRGLVAVRSWFDEIDENVMSALVQGEKHVLEAYEEAIAQTDVPQRREALTAMRDEQIAVMDRHCPPA